jgi:probable rRNA maturation factor
MLDLVYENQTEDGQWSEKFFRRALETATEYLNMRDKKVELGLYLIRPERSQELNLKYRGKDKPTDVLSFPLEESSLEKYGILPAGDIFICLDIAKRQAEDLNIPLNQELARLCIHGLLHLLGYDHERSQKDEEEMIGLQEKIIDSLDLH